MAPDEDSAKAEKLAAAKKRLEQLKKKKAGQAVKAASIGVVDSPAARETPDLSVLSAAQGPTLLPDSQTVETAFTPSLESQKQPDRSWFAEEPVKVSIVPDAVPISKERSVEHATVDPLTILQQDIEQKALQIEGLQGKVNDLEARIISLQAGKVTDSDDDITKVLVEANATLEKRVKQLETELFEAKSSQWRQGRSKLEGYRSKDELLVEDGQFDDIDLHSAKSINAGGSKSQGIGGFLVDGFSALTGVNPRRQSVAQRSLESDLDDDLDDDLLESEFRKVREEEARKRVERIRQTKRELIQWKGWRLDLLNDWGGGRGIGEVFEI